jgi:benzoyl-CoA reductase/2-hydroxyglutaryl-CoA dehydratase subunit BcrC/BadD/HgdB
MRVFLTSPWIPAEWIRAHGLESRGIWFAENFGRAAPPVTAGVCAFAERVVRFAETQPDSAVIFTTACDQMRRGFDTAMFHGRRRAFLFNLPATQTASAKQIYRDELERLGRFLVELGGKAPSEDGLRGEILRTEAARRRLREAAPNAAARSLAGAVAQFHEKGNYAAPAEFASGKEATLALVGGPLSVADWDLFEAIEAAGGRVALNATKTGERSLCPEVDSAGLTDADALASGYFDQITDVFQRPDRRLHAWLKPRLVSRSVRGIVLRHFSRCDLWSAQAQSLRETTGLPVLPLEAGEAAGLSARDINGLRAFVEMLQ